MKKLILNEETVKQLDRIVRLYITDTNVRAVFIINTAGQVMFHRGMTKSDYFVQSIGALASGIFNATNGLAKLLGSKYFNAAFQEGKKFSFYYYAIDIDTILLSFYDNTSMIGVIQVMAKKAAESIYNLMSDEKQDNGDVITGEFKDTLEGLIDNMFGK